MCSELLTQWYVYFLRAALNVRLSFTVPQDLHFRHLSCIHVLVNNIRDNRQAWKDDRFFRNLYGDKKDIVAPKKLSQLPLSREDFQIVTTAFHCFKRYLRSGVFFLKGGRVWLQVTSNANSVITKNPGNTQGTEQAFGHWMSISFFKHTWHILSVILMSCGVNSICPCSGTSLLYILEYWWRHVKTKT